MVNVAAHASVLAGLKLRSDLFRGRIFSGLLLTLIRFDPLGNTARAMRLALYITLLFSQQARLDQSHQTSTFF